MNTPITVGDVVTVVLYVGGIVAFLGLCLFVLSLMNPFGTGH